jgi:subtilisin family serine protease
MNVLTLLFLISTTYASELKPSFEDGPDARIASALRQAIPAVGSARIARPDRSIRVNTSGEYYLRISLTEWNDRIATELSDLGTRVTIAAHDLRLVEGWIAPENVRAVASHPLVRFIRGPGRRVSRVGSVTTQGDAIMRADLVRADGHDGTGVKIGVISDDVDHMSEAIASGDLPSGINVTVPSGDGIGGDEGTAMLEIIHDLAPGADLYFASTGESSLAMREMIYALADSGCRVIVDDIGWSGEPYFEDGMLAKAVDSVAKRGVVYVTSAGNSAESHYQNRYYPANSDNKYHAWDDVDKTSMKIRVLDGEFIGIVLQWDEEFGKAGIDIDLALYSSATFTGLAPLATSYDQQRGYNDPIEYASYTNDTGADMDVYVVISRYQTTATPLLGLYVFGDYLDLEISHAEGSIYGQPAAKGAIAVGAMHASDASYPQIADYSSRGPVNILFPEAEERMKPDVIGITGVFVSGAGDFPTPFYGTSASAPHVAAVAGLMLDARPDWTPAQVRAAMTSTATDLGESGPDNVYGWGLVRADDAVQVGIVNVAAPGRPVQSALGPAFPNPFNPSTTVRYHTEPGEVSIRVYNSLGQPVRTLVTGYQPAGTHDVVWDARDDAGRPVASGVYLVRMTTTTTTSTARVTLLR